MSPETSPPRCMKLSTKGVRPNRMLKTVRNSSPTNPEPRNVQRAKKLTMQSAQAAPKRPKTEADAPKEITPGRSTTDTMVPKIPESTYSRPMRHQPNMRSNGNPRARMASMLKSK
eukprot:scaffold148700_cov34-Tisochrysis_lutea.AAC.2